jgi:hypothetical protein
LFMCAVDSILCQADAVTVSLDGHMNSVEVVPFQTIIILS